MHGCSIILWSKRNWWALAQSICSVEYVYICITWLCLHFSCCYGKATRVLVDSKVKKKLFHRYVQCTTSFTPIHLYHSTDVCCMHVCSSVWTCTYSNEMTYGISACLWNCMCLFPGTSVHGRSITIRCIERRPWNWKEFSTKGAECIAGCLRTYPGSSTMHCCTVPLVRTCCGMATVSVCSHRESLLAIVFYIWMDSTIRRQEGASLSGRVSLLVHSRVLWCCWSAIW